METGRKHSKGEGHLTKKVKPPLKHSPHHFQDPSSPGYMERTSVGSLLLVSLQFSSPSSCCSLTQTQPRLGESHGGRTKQNSPGFCSDMARLRGVKVSLVLSDQLLLWWVESGSTSAPAILAKLISIHVDITAEGKRERAIERHSLTNVENIENMYFYTSTISIFQEL